LAATIVPENPPPTIATGIRRSVIGALCVEILDVVVNSNDGVRCGFAEYSRDSGMDQCSAAGADQLESDFHCAGSVASPAHPERPWMFEEQVIDSAFVLRML
jgi:hypothetical protein